jgi:hypothetical protein
LNWYKFVAGKAMLEGATVGLPAACVATIALAQPTPPAISICDTPSMRGTAIYNRYCTGGGNQQTDGPSSQAVLEQQRIQQQRIEEQRRQEEIAARHDAAVAAFQRGMEAGGRADWASAIAEFQRALSNAPGDPAILAQLRRAQNGLQDAQAAERIRAAGAQFHSDLQAARSSTEANNALDAAALERARQIAADFRRSIAAAHHPPALPVDRGTFGTAVSHPNLPPPEPRPKPGSDTNAGRQLKALADWARWLLGLPETKKDRSSVGFDNTAPPAGGLSKPSTESTTLIIPERLRRDPDVVKLRAYESQLGPLQAASAAARARYQTERARNPASPQLPMLRFHALDAQDRATAIRNTIKVQTEKVKEMVHFVPMAVGPRPEKAKP